MFPLAASGRAVNADRDTEPRPTVASSPKLWKLGGLGPVQLARNVAGEIRRNRSLGRASELAFDFLFALFPSDFFVLALFGLFASRSQQLQQNFISYFGEFVPGAAYQLLRTVITRARSECRRRKADARPRARGMVRVGRRELCNIGTQHSLPGARGAIVATCPSGSGGLDSHAVGLVAGGIVPRPRDREVYGLVGRRTGAEPYTVGLWRAARWPASIFFVLISYSLIYFLLPILTRGAGIDHAWRGVWRGGLARGIRGVQNLLEVLQYLRCLIRVARRANDFARLGCT